MSKADRTRTARERLAAERVADAARVRRTRLLLVVAGVVAAAAVVAVVVAVVAGQKGGNGGGGADAVTYSGPSAPVGREADGSVTMAKTGVSKPVLEVFEDFQCPACKALEASLGGTMRKLAADGKVKLVYRPFHLFQQEPLSGNSERGANAALCVPADKWLSYHDTLYKRQPEEGDKGFSPDELVKWGHQLGVGDANFEPCVRGMQKKSQVDQMTTYALDTRHVQGTPTMFLNGRKLEVNSEDGLTKAVEQAAGK
ncbi:DsbA family protein [Actinomadura rupiterrae]|uniref:DsbA family protein n=1 Tax=Actinomadura rupiterrae TaxID=559627 RepID=UPI0020A403CC|nr:thioredoxin domain-containing protein [Actinomadura rupiterrae]MCP2338211.1 protein-disulfide isomerase [Actinomadura rupiterrae]